MKADFRFDSQLSVFLDRAKRGQAFEYDCARAATLRNAIEALGVPHTEVGALRVNGEPATLQRIVREGDYFVRCPGCNGVFWPGSHYRRMLSALRSSFDAPS